MNEAGGEAGEWPTGDRPSSWDWIAFEEIFKDTTSSDKKLKQKLYEEEGDYPVIDQGQDFIGGYTNNKDLVHPSDSPVIIFGDHTRCAKFVDFPFVQGADGVKVLKPTPLIDSSYGFLLLKAVSLPDKGYSRHSKFLRATKFPVAPLPEQRRIVAKIETLQERSRKARAALEAIPPLLEQFRQSVLAAAFRGDLTADWRAQHPDVEPASVLLDRIRADRRCRWEEAELAKMQAKGKMPKNEKWKERYKELEAVDETELPELPGGWCWARAEQICDLITKGTTPAKDKMFSQNGDIPFVKVYNLTDKGILDFTVNPTFVSEKTHSTELARSRILPGDVLMNIVGPPLGKVSIVPEIYPEWNMNQAMAVFRSLSGYDRSFLAFCLLTDQILSVAVLRAKATAGQFNLTLEICRDLPLPVAPTEEQKHIVSKLKLCLSTVESLEISVASKLELLDQLDQSILAKAFRGELVPQDPNDEPASVLLERIRAEREAQSAKPRAKKKTPGSTKHTKKAPPVSVNENDDLPLFNNLQK